MFAAILILLALPALDFKSTIHSTKFLVLYQSLFWFFIALVICLGWLGSQPAEPPYIIVGQITTFLYFFFFICVSDFGKLETLFIKYTSEFVK